MKETAIKLEGISKKYTIGKEKDSSLRGTLSGLFSKNFSKNEEFWALKNISFEIEKGDVVGIIGRNGAGKSTLLKILSQITKPTEGKIEINGRIASLLEVGTGFHPELTGRENIFLNGTILGMSRKEVAAKFDEIVAFSGIEKFIDTPVKHYSSGMYVRLAFAVAAHLEPEILIIDEVLAVGDAEFQKKCLGKMKDVAGEGRTVLFVSHDLAAVKNLCNKGVLLKNSKIDILGRIDEVIARYNEINTTSTSLLNLERKKGISSIFRFIEFSLNEGKNISCGEIINLKVLIQSNGDLSKVNFGFAVKDLNDTLLFECRSYRTNISDINIKQGIYELNIDIESHLLPGTYKISIGAVGQAGDLDYLDNFYAFQITEKNDTEPWFKNKLGTINVDHHWKLQQKND